MLAKAAAACIPARSRGGGCNLVASAQAVGARALPGEGCSCTVLVLGRSSRLGASPQSGGGADNLCEKADV